MREAIAQQVTAEFVHRLYPSFCAPAYLACPDEEGSQAVLKGIQMASIEKGVPVELVDLSPAPGERLDEITARLSGSPERRTSGKKPPVRLLTLEGFDLLFVGTSCCVFKTSLEGNQSYVLAAR